VLLPHSQAQLQLHWQSQFAQVQLQSQLQADEEEQLPGPEQSDGQFFAHTQLQFKSL
jgi:hypothetical protein